MSPPYFFINQIRFFIIFIIFSPAFPSPKGDGEFGVLPFDKETLSFLKRELWLPPVFLHSP